MWTELICILQNSPTKLTDVSQGGEHTGNDRTRPFPQPQACVTR